MNEIINRSAETLKRRKLRRQMPPAEQILWARLRACQIDGLKFRRQHSVGCYVLDFYCPSRKLAVELDGDSHASEAAYEHDQRRETYLKDHDIQVIRFPNEEVFRRLNQVIDQIVYAANLRSRPPLAPP